MNIFLRRALIAWALAGVVCLVALATALLPPPQQARAQFGGQGLVAASVGGSANALTMTIYNMNTLVKGVPFSFTPASTNTGPTTINVNSLGNTTVRRPSSLGLVGLSGGEFQSGVLTTVVYDGTNINLVYPVNPAPIGSTLELRIAAGTSGASAATPPGYLIEDGSCISQTQYAALFGLIGTSYGSCSAGLFALPDSRGVILAAADNQGANGSANRITSGGSGCTATSAGNLCGSQSQTLTLAQLPTGIATSGVNTIIVNPSGDPTRYVASTVSGGIVGQNAQTSGGTANAPTSPTTWTGTNFLQGPNTITAVSTNTTGNSHPILPPISLIIRYIKY